MYEIDLANIRKLRGHVRDHQLSTVKTTREMIKDTYPYDVVSSGSLGRNLLNGLKFSFATVSLTGELPDGLRTSPEWPGLTKRRAALIGGLVLHNEISRKTAAAVPLVTKDINSPRLAGAASQFLYFLDN